MQLQAEAWLDQLALVVSIASAKHLDSVPKTAAPSDDSIHLPSIGAHDAYHHHYLRCILRCCMRTAPSPTASVVGATGLTNSAAANVLSHSNSRNMRMLWPAPSASSASLLRLLKCAPVGASDQEMLRLLLFDRSGEYSLF